MNIRVDIIIKKEQIIKWLSEGRSRRSIYLELGCRPSTLNYHIKQWNASYKPKHGWRKGVPSEKRKHVSEYLGTGKFIPTHALKLKLFRDGVKEERCEGCLLKEWLGGQIPLELHHIDGNNKNNQLMNLKVLCPNCHALTDNHAGKGKKRRRLANMP